MYFRNIALACVLVSGFALPALAQTVTQDATPAPQADSATPLPDAGVKKAPATPVKHKHRATHLAHKAKIDAPAKAN